MDAERMLSDPDYLDLPRYQNSLKNLLQEYPDGTPIPLLCKAIGFTEAQYQEKLKEILLKLRKRL
jgi:hypothetical protein